MQCSVIYLLVLTCAGVQSLQGKEFTATTDTIFYTYPAVCGDCECYTGDGGFGGIYWNHLKTTSCYKSKLTSIPDTSSLPADTEAISIFYQSIPKMKEKQFISFKKLQVILIHSSLLSVVESHAFLNMTDITIISLQKNSISKLPTDLFTETDVPNIKMIYLSFNKLKLIQKNLFSNLEQLEGVFLDNNEIVSIEDNSFVNLPILKHINLSKNKLSSLNFNFTSNLINTHFIYLYSNPWNCVQILCETMIYYNEISKLWKQSTDYGITPKCESPAELKGKKWNDAISICNLSSIQPGERNCGTCHCTDDSLTVTCLGPLHPWIPHTILKGIIKLNITGQNIPTIIGNTFFAYEQLQILLLENNHINTIKSNVFEPLKNITTISLRYNNLTSLHKFLFSNLLHLKDVDLSHNEINFIEKKCFLNVPLLERVDLSFNNLKSLKSDAFGDLNKLSLLALHENPWKCDEFLCEIMNAVVSQELWATDKIPICAEPSYVRTKPWNKILPKFQPNITSKLTNVTEGDNVTMYCHFCFISRVIWIFNGKKLPRHYQEISEGISKLTLEKVGKEQEGYYECQVNYCENCKTDELHLSVTPRESFHVKQIAHRSNKPENSSNVQRGILIYYYTYLPYVAPGKTQDDTVSQDKLLEKILNSTLPNNN